jgi:hypothetical protein
VHDLVGQLASHRLAFGAAVFEHLRRPAIQPVSQFLDGLHVASHSLFDMDFCNLAQFFEVLPGCGELQA